MRALILASLLVLGGCAISPRPASDMTDAEVMEHHHDMLGMVHGPVAVVTTDLATEQASTNELAYQLGAAWLLDRKDRPCDYYEAQAYAALLYTRMADEDAKAAAQFGFNRTLKELRDYVQGTVTPPEGWC